MTLCTWITVPKNEHSCLSVILWCLEVPIHVWVWTVLRGVALFHETLFKSQHADNSGNGTWIEVYDRSRTLDKRSFLIAIKFKPLSRVKIGDYFELWRKQFRSGLMISHSISEFPVFSSINAELACLEMRLLKNLRPNDTTQSKVLGSYQLPTFLSK